PRATVVALAVSADGAHVASGDSYGTALLWRTSDGARYQLIDPDEGSPQKNNGIAFRGDGRPPAARGRDGGLRIWDVTKRTLASRLERRPADTISGLAYSPDGQYLTSIDSGGAIVFWDARTGEPRVLGQHPDPYALAWHPGGDFVATGGGARAIR